MDAIISQYDFDHNLSARAKECIDQVSVWVDKNRKRCDIQILLNSIEIIGTKLTEGHCPSYQSEGWRQADAVFRSIMLIKTKKGEQRERFHKAMVGLMVKLLHDGPTTIHMELIRHVLFNLEDYIKSLEGQDVTDIIIAACSPINIKEDTQYIELIYQLYEQVITMIVEHAFKREELTKKHNLIHLFNFILHTYLDYIHLEKGSYDHVVRCGYNVYKCLGTSLEELDDITVIRGFIQRINTAVKQSFFPHSKAVEGNTRMLFVYIRAITQKPGDAEQLSNDVFDLLESITQCKTYEMELILDMFSIVFSFFSKQKKDVIQNNTSLFKVIIHRFKRLFETADIKFIADTEFVPDMMFVLKNIDAKKIDRGPDGLRLICPLLKRPCYKTVTACKCIFEARHEMQWKSLEGQEIADIIEAVCSPITSREDKLSIDFLYHFFEKFVANIVGGAVRKEELRKKQNMIPLFNFIVNMYLDYPHLKTDSYERVVKCGYKVHSYLDPHWEELDDISVIRGFIQRINTAVKDPLFPYREAVEQNTRQLFVYIRKITEKHGDAAKFSNDVFDLLESITQCQTHKSELILDMFSSVINFFSQQQKCFIKNNTSLFKFMLPRFKIILERADIKFFADTDYAPDLVDVLRRAYARNEELDPEYISLIAPLLKQPCYKTIMACRRIFEGANDVQWKDHQGVVDSIFEALSTIEITRMWNESMCSNLKSCTSEFLKILRNSRMLKNYGEGLMFLCIQHLETMNEHLFETAEKVAENIEINSMDMKDSVMWVLKRLYTLLRSDDLPWMSNRDLKRAVDDLLEKTIHTFANGKIFSDVDMRFLISTCIMCLNQRLICPHDNTEKSSYCLVANSLMRFLPERLGSTKRLKLAMGLVKLLVKLWDCDEDEEVICEISWPFLQTFANFQPVLLAPFLDQFITFYLQKDYPRYVHCVLDTIKMVYPKHPKPLTVHFQTMIARMFDYSNKGEMIWLTQIFCEASKKQPELFTQENMTDLVHLTINETTMQGMFLQIVQELARRKPETMITNVKLIISTEWNPVYSFMLNDIVSTLALNVQSAANEVIDYLLESVRTNQEKGNTISALNAIRLLGFKYPNTLKPKRQVVERLRLIDADGISVKQTILDMIDGKTSKELTNQLNEQKEALINLVNRVDDVEGTLVEMDEELAHQGEQIDNISNEVTEQGQRTDKIEETVKETVSKVEEIDGKTLSHAPYWSRDISKLLNPQTEHDWRLLSSRLGYSNDNISGWAQQADPCMAMLNEWYATRQTSEASLAVLFHLQEIERIDAAIIVENSMKNTEAVVEEENFEYATHPSIFISYQWGDREKVKLLQHHLEMAGYECWMDIGQMGGGDRLLEKIDLGIRACKVVISCVTSEYTKSPSCSREVNLSIRLSKPVIPLLMEQCPWPPPGYTGPIFSESLFIRFFQRPGEETIDQRYWSQPKFLKLLMQIYMNGVSPNESKIQPAYTNWWIPLEETSNIDQNQTMIKIKTDEDSNMDSLTHCDVEAQDGTYLESQRSPTPTNRPRSPLQFQVPILQPQRDIQFQVPILQPQRDAMKIPEDGAPEDEHSTLDGNSLITLNDMDRHAIFGQYVANNMRQMSNEQQIYVEKIISDVLFEGRLGNVSRLSRFVTGGKPKTYPNDLLKSVV